MREAGAGAVSPSGAMFWCLGTVSRYYEFREYQRADTKQGEEDTVLSAKVFSLLLHFKQVPVQELGCDDMAPN